MSESVISTTTNSSAMTVRHVEQLRVIHRAKQEEKQYLKEQFIKRLKTRNHLLHGQVNWSMSEEAIKLHIEKWESHFDDKLLFEPNMRSVGQCLTLLCFNGGNMGFIMSQLRRMLEQFSVTLDDPLIQQFIKKRKKQFSGNEIPPLDYETFDSSIDCYLLQLMRQCFDYYVALNCSSPQSSSSSVDMNCTEILDSCFARITLDTPYAIRNQASLLLGSMSQVFLEPILNYYMKRFDAMNPKKDAEAKEMAIYSQVLKVLLYSLGKASSRVMKLLEALATKIPQVTKGTTSLYPELCSGINKILIDILSFNNWGASNSQSGTPVSPATPSSEISRSFSPNALQFFSSTVPQQQIDRINIRKLEYQQFQQFSADEERKLCSLLVQLFDLMQKIIKSKSKHRVICTGTMFCIISVLPEDIYLKSGSEMLDAALKNMTASLKEKKERCPIFQYFVQYLQYSPSKILQKEVVKISNCVNGAHSILFNKKNVLGEEEHATIEQFLVEYARTNLPASCKFIEEVLRSQPSTEKRIIVLNALSKIVQFTPLQQLAPYDVTLGILLNDCLQDESLMKNNKIVLPTISCLPRIRAPSETLMKQARRVIGTFLLSPDLPISIAASTSLNMNVQIDPLVSFTDVLETYLKVLLRVNEIPADDAVRLLNDLCSCIEIFVTCCTEQGLKLAPEDYRSIRQRLEGLCLIWIIHPNSAVRVKATQLFSTLARENVRMCMNDLCATYIFDDLLKLERCEEVQERDVSMVGPLSKQFSCDIDSIWNSLSVFFKLSDNASLVFAWHETLKIWNAPIIRGGIITNKEIVLMLNLTKFMCKAIRSGKKESAAVFVRDLIQLLASKNKALHERLHFIVLQVLACVPESNLHVVFEQIRSVGAPRIVIKEKKKERVESSDLIFESNILELLETYISRGESISTEYLFQNDDQTVLSYYEQLIVNWTTGELQANDIPASTMNADMWKQASNIIQHYFNHLYKLCMAAIRLYGGTLDEHYNSNSPLMLKSGAATLTKSVFDFVSLNNPIATIDSVAINALTSILQFSEVQSTELMTEILEYFHTVISYYKVDKALITNGMATLLELNPQLFKLFVMNTRAELLLKTFKSSDFQQAKAKRFQQLRTTSPHQSTNSFSVFTKKDAPDTDNLYKEIEDDDMKLEAIHDICVHYMQAIAQVMKSLFVYCVQDKDKWQTNIGACLFLGLTNACASNNAPLRSAALDLIQSICDAENNDLDYGCYLLFHSSEDENACIPSILDLSAYCASKDIKLTVEIFAEAERVVLDLNDYNREITLRILEPWAYNYGQLLQQSISHGKRVVYSPPQQIHRSIFNITKKLTEYAYENEARKTNRSSTRKASRTSVSQASPNGDCSQQLLRTQTTSFQLYLERIWYQLMRSRETCTSVSKTVVDMIIAELGSSANSSAVLQQMLRNILFWCARDINSTASIIQQLMSHLKNYELVYPHNKLEFTLWQLNNQMNTDVRELCVAESNALQILSQLAYEHALDFIPHLPVLLVQAIVDFHSTRLNPRKEATILLENLFQNLVVRRRVSDTHLSSALEFMKSTFRNSSQDTKLDLKYSRDGEFIRNYVRFFEISHCPGLAQKTASVALISAIQARDIQTSLESFHLFYHLNTQFDSSIVETLSLCLFDAIRTKNQHKIQIIFNILEKIPDEVCARNDVNCLLFKISITLIHSWNIDHFACALRMILKLRQLSTHPTRILPINHWPAEFESMDATISKALTKGLFSYKTYDSTLEMLESFASLDTLPQDNMFSAVIVLCYYMLVCCGRVSRRDRILSVITQGNKGLQRFLEVFKQSIDRFAPSLYSSGAIDQSTDEYRLKLDTFSQTFSKVFVSVFSSKNGSFITSLLISIMIHGPEGWSVPSMHLLSNLLPSLYSAEVWTADDCVQLSYNLRETSIHKNKILSASAHTALNYLLNEMNQDKSKHWQQEQVLSTFNFLAPIRGFEQSVAAQSSNSDKFFNGVTNTKLTLSREQMMKMVWIQSLELALTGENAEIFQRMVDNTAFGLLSRTGSFRTSSFVSSPDLSQHVDTQPFVQPPVEEPQYVHVESPPSTPPPPPPPLEDEVRDSPVSPNNQ